MVWANTRAEFVEERPSQPSPKGSLTLPPKRSRGGHRRLAGKKAEIGRLGEVDLLKCSALASESIRTKNQVSY